MNSRKVFTAFFAAMCLFSVAVAQEFHSIVQEVSPSDHVQTIRGDLEAAAAWVVPALAITPITWGVVGLDSNNVTTGPNVFPVGARVCNTGTSNATNVASTFVWDTANALINLRTGSRSALSQATLAPSACTDFYYEIEITRTSTAYNTTRGFHITATADGLGIVSTPIPRELYIEKLISQNRNSVVRIKLNGVNVPFGGTMNLVVGSTYTITLDASTATNGYEQLESFINLPNVVFQTLSVSSTYTAPAGYTGNKFYEDACGWNAVPASPTYRTCIGPFGVPGGKAGGTVSLTYTVKILSGAGTSRTLNTLIYDLSGISYHYNSDFSAAFVTASITAPPTAASVSISGRVTTAEGYGIRNAIVYLTQQDGTVASARTGTFGYYRFDDIPAGQTVFVSVASKRYTFNLSTRVVNLNDDVSDFDWVSNE